MTLLYLVRHGETVDNANQVMQGQTPGRLNEAGIRQAEALAVKMADVKIDTFVSSDLKRAMDTAEIVARPHAMQLHTTPLLRERDWGSFTGRYIPDLKDVKWTDDIETLDQLQERAQRFLEYIKSDYPNQVVLAVGHGIINKAIQAVYYHKPMNQIEKMTNAEVRVLKL
jgi:broad specificity phosphatase PhoE